MLPYNLSKDKFEKSKTLDFKDLFSINEIQKIQDAFSDATGVASIITYPDGKPITNPSNFCVLCNQLIRKTDKGLKNCIYSDSVIGRNNPAGPIIQPCLSGGLWDAGASITVGGQHIANWLIGQVRNDILDEEQILKYSEDIGIDTRVFKEALDKVPVMSKEKFEKIANALFIISNKLSNEAYLNYLKEIFIKEQQAVEKALKESEEKFRKAFTTSPDAITINRLDDGMYFSVNKGFSQITGYTEKEVIGHTASEIKIWIEHNDLIKFMGELKQKETIENYEFPFRMKNGQIRYGLLSASLVDFGGEPHIISITRDITERRHFEEELRKAKEEAEKSNKLKDAFIANISHEIRTPLNGILGMSSLIRDNLEPYATDDDKMFFNSIERSSTRLMNTVDMILNFSRLQVNDFEVNPQEIHLTELIETLIKDNKKNAEARSIDLIFENKCGEVTLKFDEYCFNNAVSQLIDNALKFTLKGFVKIILYVEKNKLKLDILDTGVGISEEYQKILFIPYTQEEMSYGRSFEGIGIGLSMVKKFLDFNNARITVESKKNEGTKFTIHLEQ